MIQVRSYGDYRSYLKDYIAFCEQRRRGFSARQLCLKVGLGTDNYVQRIVKGRRNMSLALAERFIPVLGLRGQDADYFRALVGTEAARTQSERQHYAHQVNRLAASMSSVGRRRVDNGILRHWYLAAIWELASCGDGRMTLDYLVKCLGGKVSRARAAEALAFLVADGYLEQVGDDQYRKVMAPVYSSDGVSDPFVRLNHSHMLEAAQESINLPLEQRLLYGLTIAVDAGRLPEVQDRIRSFLEDLRKELNLHANPNSVYRVGVQAFPLAREPQ